MTKIMSPEELEQDLRAIGAAQYHDKHPFHKPVSYTHLTLPTILLV